MLNKDALYGGLMIDTDANKLAREILDEQKGEAKKKGKAAIDIEERKIIDIVAEDDTLPLLQKLGKEYSNRRIYLLKTDAKGPVVWSR